LCWTLLFFEEVPRSGPTAKALGVPRVIPTTIANDATVVLVIRFIVSILSNLSLYASIGKKVANDCSCLSLYDGQMIGRFEGFGVNLVNLLSARRAGGEPPMVCHHFKAANWSVISWGGSQLGGNIISSQCMGGNGIGGHGGKNLFLGRGGWSVDPGIVGPAELLFKTAIVD
jgi:hypothetical protein